MDELQKGLASIKAFLLENSAFLTLAIITTVVVIGSASVGVQLANSIGSDPSSEKGLDQLEGQLQEPIVEIKCIVTISGFTYDITELQTTHSGGDVFKCGQDETESYINRHGESLSRMSHYLIDPVTGIFEEPEHEHEEETEVESKHEEKELELELEHETELEEDEHEDD